MANNNYCAVIKDFDAAVTLRTGEVSAQQPAELLNSVAARVLAMPLKLQ